jgi:fibrillarin-like pre-rRNA processing protein
VKRRGPRLVELPDGRLATENLDPGTDVYGEDLVRRDDAEHRVWDPSRSKLAAALLKGVPELPFGPGDTVLYLGGGAGTTVSHVSDVVGEDGRVVAVDASPWAVRDLLDLADDRDNVVPVLADAAEPDAYAPQVPGVDAVVQDVAQRNQADILLRNLDRFEPPRAFVAVKARSVDVAADPRRIADEQLDRLQARGWSVAHRVSLEPYEEAHTAAVVEDRRDGTARPEA